jgi:hypothetical protein
MNDFVFFVPLVAVLSVVTLALALEARRFRSRAPAEQKSVALLRSWLTPEQLDQWNSREEFEVIGGDTGTRYRITCGTVMNVHQLDHTGKPFARSGASDLKANLPSVMCCSRKRLRWRTWNVGRLRWRTRSAF